MCWESKASVVRNFGRASERGRGREDCILKRRSKIRNEKLYGTKESKYSKSNFAELIISSSEETRHTPENLIKLLQKCLLSVLPPASPIIFKSCFCISQMQKFERRRGRGMSYVCEFFDKIYQTRQLICEKLIY